MSTSEMTPDQQKARIGAIVESACKMIVERGDGDGFVMSIVVANLVAWLAEHVTKANGKSGLEDWFAQVYGMTIQSIEQSTGIRLAVSTDLLALTRAIQDERTKAIQAVRDIHSISNGVKDTVVRAIQMRSA